ncbi:hypothetical protein IJ095_01670 [Candidatus Saccharibacteria bacterium]|nr:hypothetical protein [Candidatus Saccharibacteria bacterium]
MTGFGTPLSYVPAEGESYATAYENARSMAVLYPVQFFHPSRGLTTIYPALPPISNPASHSLGTIYA